MTQGDPMPDLNDPHNPWYLFINDSLFRDDPDLDGEPGPHWNALLAPLFEYHILHESRWVLDESVEDSHIRRYLGWALTQRWAQEHANTDLDLQWVIEHAIALTLRMKEDLKGGAEPPPPGDSPDFDLPF